MLTLGTIIFITTIFLFAGWRAAQHRRVMEKIYKEGFKRLEELGGDDELAK
jgi:hypothetical protein